MDRLSVATVQKRLLETEEVKAKYETMKMRKSGMREVGKPSDPSTKITKIEQVNANGLQDVSDVKGKPFVHQAELAPKYTDKMPHGVFRATDANEGGPKTPSVEKSKPNQTTKLKQVKPDSGKLTKEGKNSKSFWPQADYAETYVDAMPHGKIYSKDTKGTEVKAPKAENLHGTTRPKSSEKKANMTRNPSVHVKNPAPPADSMKKPSDAPKKPSWEKVKSGVAVRVNEHVKARFSVISENVLTRFVNNYKRFGYEVVVEAFDNAAWKTDKTFLNLLHRVVSAKHNKLDESCKQLRNQAMKRFFETVRSDYSHLYESRDHFLKTVQSAYATIEGLASAKYRDKLSLHEGKARIFHEGQVHDVELLTEAEDHGMALRLIRHRLFEHFGLGTRIQHIFVDGRKYDPRQIPEWTGLKPVTRKAA